MGHVSALCGASLSIIPIFTILIGVPTKSLFLGITKYNECPLEPLLPLSLLVFGLIGSICSIVALIFIVTFCLKVDDSGTHLSYLLFCMITVFVYGISATILACIIAFTRGTENTSDSKSFCHESIYNFCDVFATIVIPLALTFTIWFARLLITRFLSRK